MAVKSKLDDGRAKIWCLFGIANEYDQPNNNLECWWHQRPSIEQLCDALGVELGKDDDTTVAVVSIWTNKTARILGVDYRLQTVSEGLRLAR